MSAKFPNGMSFKQAGVSHLLGWHEVEDGNMVQGIVEVMGERDTYIRHAKFSTGASKKTVIDAGDPKHDDEQANDNFAHVVKKQRTDNRTTTQEELGDIIKAALAKVTNEEGSSTAAASCEAGAEGPSVGGAPDSEDDGEDEGAAERAAEAALISIGRKRKLESGKNRALKRGMFGKVVGLPRQRSGAWMPHGDCPAHSLFGWWVQGAMQQQGGCLGCRLSQGLRQVSPLKSLSPAAGDRLQNCTPMVVRQIEGPRQVGQPQRSAGRSRTAAVRALGLIAGGAERRADASV